MDNNDLNDPFHPENIALYKKFHDLCKKEQWSYSIHQIDGDHSWEFVVTTYESDFTEFRDEGHLYNVGLNFILKDIESAVGARVGLVHEYKY